MNNGIPMLVSFQLKRPVSVAMRMHLLGIDDLNLGNHFLHGLDHFFPVRAVVGQEVYHPHRPGFADVEIRQPLARGARVFPFPPLEVDRQTEDRVRGRS